jgi:hypothetical protein
LAVAHPSAKVSRRDADDRLHAIRLSSGGLAAKLHRTANDIYAVVSRTMHATIDGLRDESLDAAT